MDQLPEVGWKGLELSRRWALIMSSTRIRWSTEASPKGYKSGGMNLGGLEGYDPTQPGGVSPTNTLLWKSRLGYEAGWKNSVLDNQLRLN